MIKIKRPNSKRRVRVPKLRPASPPGWYKRFRQLSSIAGKPIRLK